MPWLGVYVGKIPGATGNLQILLDHCVRFTTARVQRGSDTKDLFHYLVRVLCMRFELQLHLHLSHTARRMTRYHTEQRGFTRQSRPSRAAARR